MPDPGIRTYQGAEIGRQIDGLLEGVLRRRVFCRMPLFGTVFHDSAQRVVSGQMLSLRFEPCLVILIQVIGDSQLLVVEF